MDQFTKHGLRLKNPYKTSANQVPFAFLIFSSVMELTKSTFPIYSKRSSEPQWFATASHEALHGTLFRQAFALLQSEILGSKTGQGSPCSVLSPKDLLKHFDFSLGTKRLEGDNFVIQCLQNLFALSPRPSHPLFLGKHHSGLDTIALVADFATTTVSNPILSYLWSPVFTLQEEEVKKGLRDLVGYPGIGEGAVMTDSGVTTITAIACALQARFPEIKKEGYFGPKDLPSLCVLASEFGGPYLERACVVSGLGSDALIKVKTGKTGRMEVPSLMETLEVVHASGRKVVMIVATLGSDPHGAIDPLEEIAEICENHGIWLHVDGHYGGPLVFLEDDLKAKKLKGIERSDSFAIGTTGMLGTPVGASIFLTKSSGILSDAVGLGANGYIFRENPLYDRKADNGNASLHTCRRAEASSLWLMWQVKGRRGLGLQIYKSLELAKEFNEVLKRRDNFEAVVSELDTTRVSFYHESFDKHDIAEKVKKILGQYEKCWLDTTKIPGYQFDCFCVSVTNPNLTLEALSYVLDLIEDVTPHLINGGRLSGFNPRISKTEIWKQDFPEDNALLQQVFDMLQTKALYLQEKRECPVLKFRKPEQLLQEFPFGVGDDPLQTSTEHIVKTLENVIDFSIQTGHPLYVYHVKSGGGDPYAMIADFVTAVLTSTTLSFEESPLYSLMEEEVCRQARKRIGYPEFGDGVCLPGGSMSIITAQVVARTSRFPETIRKGILGLEGRLIVFMSENAHYSTQKGGIIQGLGLNNVVLVPADGNGAMDVVKLEESIEAAKNNGGIPFFVVATAGTTVLGKFDPIKAIAKVCQKHNLWLHIDGSIGVGYLFSDKEVTTSLKDVHLANSLNFNMHKSLGLTQTGSILLFRDGGLLDTVFPEGPRSGICWDRRPHILKLWLTWKAKGTEGIGLHVEHTLHLKNFIVAEIQKPKRQSKFMLCKPDFDTAAVCFYYIPDKLRVLSRDSEEFKEKLDIVSERVHKRMVEAGIVIGTFRDGKAPQFLKIHFMSSGTSEEDLIYLLDLIDYHCYDVDHS